MENYWLQQTIDKPLYPDLIWSRPENKAYAGKLLIIGGNSFGFSTPVTNYSEAQKAGVGLTRVILPDSTKKIVGRSSADLLYSPSNLSGSFGTQALADFLDNADWSDGTLLAGELGNNSETVVLIEKFLDKYSGLALLSGDSVDLILNFYESVLQRSELIMITDVARLQKLQVKSRELHPINSQISLSDLINNLHEFTINHKPAIVLEHQGFMIVAFEGQVSTTKLALKTNNQNKLAAHCAVWSIQNPSKVFEALSCSGITYQSS